MLRLLHLQQPGDMKAASCAEAARYMKAAVHMRRLLSDCGFSGPGGKEVHVPLRSCSGGATFRESLFRGFRVPGLGSCFDGALSGGGRALE